MKSLANRFNGNAAEVLDYIKHFGIFAAMTKYDVKDYVAMKNWVVKETGNENYGINASLLKLNVSGDRSLIDQFIEKFADYVVKKEVEISEKDKTITELKKQLNFYQEKDVRGMTEKLATLMEALET